MLVTFSFESSCRNKTVTVERIVEVSALPPIGTTVLLPDDVLTLQTDGCGADVEALWLTPGRLPDYEVRLEDQDDNIAFDSSEQRDIFYRSRGYEVR